MTATEATAISRLRSAAFAWRIVLVLVTAVVVAVSAPAWLRAPLSLLTALVVLVPLVRLRRRGPLDVVLVVVGGGAAALALTGLLLDALPAGLAPTTWGVAIGVLELVGLGVTAARTPGVPLADSVSARQLVRATGWTAAVVGVLAVSVGWAAASFQATHTAPLAVQLQRQDGDRAVVEVTSGTAAGPFHLDLVTDRGRTVLADDVRVGPARNATVTVRLGTASRGLVQLVPDGAVGPVRQLILDTSASPR